MARWGEIRAKRVAKSLVAFGLVLACAFSLSIAYAMAATPELISVAMDGSGAGGVDSGSMGISADGRYVAFASSSPNLVPGDTNGATDVFVRDRVAGTTTRVSVASDGSQTVPPFFPLSGGSSNPAISADGRYVVFGSGADNLYPWREHCGPWCPGELDGNLYVHDMLTGTTTIAGTAADGTPANQGVSRGPILSASGRYVAFSSVSTNLVPGPLPGDFRSHVYVKDLQTGAITRVSVASDGQVSDPAPSFSAPLAISDDGGIVVFESSAALDPAHPVASVYAWHRATDRTEGVGCCWGNFRSLPGGISGDGRVFGVGPNGQTTSAYWSLDSFSPAGLLAVPGSTGAPLLSDDGSTFFFRAVDDRTGDGLGPGIFAVNRSGGPVTRLTAADIGLGAGTRDGRHFAGATRERLLAADTNDEIDSYVQDRINQPPTITGVPADISVTTRGTTAVVSYASPTATDPDDGPLSVACLPASGSTFPLGQTLVTCTATDSAGAESSASFDVTVSSIRPRILTQPTSRTVVAGQLVAFSAAASGTPPPTVQWQERAPGGRWVDVPGATTTTYAFLVTAAQSQHRFRAVFTNANGTANTAAATLAVQVPPTITAQPTDATVRAGRRASFTAAADGSPRAIVQWQRSQRRRTVRRHTRRDKPQIRAHRQRGGRGVALPGGLHEPSRHRDHAGRDPQHQTVGPLRPPLASFCRPGRSPGADSASEPGFTVS